jgi:thiol-disulfide isomerase/thioredoxin
LVNGTDPRSLVEDYLVTRPHNLLALSALCLALPLATIRADEPPKPADSVASLLESHDRALVSALNRYIESHRDAEDLDQAYLTLFERAIEHDWFLDCEAAAKRYLRENPDGAVRPMAQIVATMARAKAGQFDDALTNYRDLMHGLTKEEQEEFAANFADSLAESATRAGEFKAAREVYEILLSRFSNPELRTKVRDDLARLDMVGKPAPTVIAKDLEGGTFRLAELKGKYVLIDFWATWCAPCVAETPALKKLHDTYGARGFEIVGVSLDETTAPLRDFVKARKIPWPQIHNLTCGSDLQATFGVSTIPATFLVGPDGTVERLELRGDSLEEFLKAKLP